MDISISEEFIKVYDKLKTIQDDIAELAKQYYDTQVVQYDEIKNTPENLSEFNNDCEFISSSKVDELLLDVLVDDTNYLKKLGEDSQKCEIPTSFDSITTKTLESDDSSENVATTEFVHNLIKKGGDDTVQTMVKTFGLKKDCVTKQEVQDAIDKSISEVDHSSIISSLELKIEDAVSEIQIPTVPTNVSSFNNDAGYITIQDVPKDAVTSVNNQTGDVIINIPTVPTNVSSFTNDVGYITDAGVTSVNNQIGAVSIQENVQANWSSTTGLSAILNKPALKRVATTGDYNDLDNLPNYADSATQGGTAKRTESIGFGIVDDTSTATNLTATVEGITELKEGTCILLHNPVVSSATGWTLNINNLGAKPVYNSKNARSTTAFTKGYTLGFVYSTHIEGGCWVYFIGTDENTNTNTLGYLIRQNNGTLYMSDKMYRYRLMFTSADGSMWVPSNTSTSTNTTALRNVNQRPINPFGPIMCYNSTGSIGAGVGGPVTTGYQQMALTLGYSFNRTGKALVLDLYKPVYVKCSPLSDGSAIIDADEPYVQELPTTEDGYIYIFLGLSYSATLIELRLEHPVYYYKNGAIRLWTAEESRIAALENRIQQLELLLNQSNE